VPIDRWQIIAEAVALLDEAGLEGVTLRKLASRLGVQAPTLYWHIRNKAALVNAIAEAILEKEFGTIDPPADDEPWPDWLRAVAHRLRRAMLAHPDGARVVSAGQLSATMATISETAIRTLIERGLTLRDARLTVLAVERFTIGHVLEEQAPRPDEETLADFDAESFAADHPTVIAGIVEYFEKGTVDTLFDDTLRVILR
jgi:TetR/AcrR family tetracycline transcriptional repressor